MNHLIAPSVLAADFANLRQDIEMLNRSEADWIHFDVMDGVFVPNISFGFPVLKAIKPLTRINTLSSLPRLVRQILRYIPKLVYI